MAYQSLNIGTTGGDGTGDTIRAGGDKINDNFTEIYTLLGTGTALTSGLSATSSVVTLAGPSITGVASFADGSASAPSITNTGDTNTGVFFSAADEVAITTGGTQRFKVTASGIEIADGGNIGSASDTDAMSISSGGVVAFSASLQVKNGATSAGFIEFFEDSDNGTNKATLIGPASTADVTLTLPAVTDTVAVVGDVIALGIALG